MRSLSHQKFNSNFIVAHLGGGENRDFAQLPSMGSASISKMHLTKTAMQTKMKVGFSSSFISIGDNSPQSLAVFLCLSFSNQLNFERIIFIMTVLFERLRSVAPVSDIANSLSTVTRLFAKSSDGFTCFLTGTTNDKIKRSHRANSRYLKQKTND